MGINGRWEAVTVPRWLMVVAGFVLGLMTVGATIGVKYAGGISTLQAMQKADIVTAARVDTLTFALDTVRTEHIQESRIIRALGRNVCRGISDTLADDLDLPCSDLRPNAAHRAGNR